MTTDLRVSRRDEVSRANRVIALLLALYAMHGVALGHDIPNQRVDRAIQINVHPGRLAVDYEVSLSELTLTQDLRNLIGSLPGGDRSAWLDEYGKITGPLNAKGLLLSVDNVPIPFGFRSFSLTVEEHPRYTFHVEANIPEGGRLLLSDTNFVASEGSSRLAARADRDVVLDTNLPNDVQKVPIRPVWDLSEEEEYRTKHADFRFKTIRPPRSVPAIPPVDPVLTAPGTGGRSGERPAADPLAGLFARKSGNLASLVDRITSVQWPIIGCFAAFLGALHALQPGHGKTIVSVLALDPSARFYQPALLGVVTTLAHISSVLLIAAVLGISGNARVESLHHSLAQVAGFTVAATGFWRLGRYLAGFAEHRHDTIETSRSRGLGLLSLGLAAGLVPCWDAVGLLLLAAAIDELAAGVELVLFFSAGMALVLASIGTVAWKLKTAALRGETASRWQGRLEVVGILLLSTAGLVLFLE